MEAIQSIRISLRSWLSGDPALWTNKEREKHARWTGVIEAFEEELEALGGPLRNVTTSDKDLGEGK